MNDYDRIGGADALRRIVRTFVDRVVDDPIIGFLFADRDRDRIVRHEAELAAAHLGGPAAYGGRPLGDVHRPLKINGGQFRRRLALLRQTLVGEGVPDDVIERWLEHDRRLEPVVTDGTDCR